MLAQRTRVWGNKVIKRYCHRFRPPPMHLALAVKSAIIS